MIKIKNASIVKEEFIKNFNDLMKREMPAKQCLELSECIDKLQAQLEVIKRAQIAITKKYAVLDKDGNLMLDDKGGAKFDNVQKNVKCLEELNEIYEQGVELSLNSKVIIYEDEIFSPFKLNMLRDIIEIKPRNNKV